MPLEVMTAVLMREDRFNNNNFCRGDFHSLGKFPDSIALQFASPSWLQAVGHLSTTPGITFLTQKVLQLRENFSTLDQSAAAFP